MSPRRPSGAIPPNRGVLRPHAWTFTAGDSVLPEAPAKGFEAGRGMPVPVLAGTNRDEGALFQFLVKAMGRLRSEGSIRRQFEDAFGLHAPAVHHM